MAGRCTRTLAQFGLGPAVGPVRWARWGPLSEALGRLVSPAAPPVAVLSLARSGSSWVGRVLGNSRGALYLREPATQRLLEARGHFGGEGETRPTPAWKRAAADAIRGLPRYRSSIVVDPSQWRLASRPGRRVVFKEVEPAALSWLLTEHACRVVFLVRHPGAVASSMKALGWWRRGGREGEDWWRANGDWQGRILAPCLRFLEGREDARLVRYEDLCAAPLERFRELYAFAGLPWDAEAERAVTSLSTAASDYRAGAYGVRRDSGRMPDRWRATLDPASIAAVAEGWLPRNVGVYDAASFRV